MKNAPEPWKDSEAMEADVQNWLLSYILEYPEESLNAFRIGWKAGAMHGAFMLMRWIGKELLGDEGPGMKEDEVTGLEQEDREEGGEE